MADLKGVRRTTTIKGSTTHRPRLEVEVIGDMYVCFRIKSEASEKFTCVWREDLLEALGVAPESPAPSGGK